MNYPSTPDVSSQTMPPESSSESAEFKNRLVSEANFELLRQCQKQIYEATEMTPSLRKIVNLVITEEAIQRVAKAMIQTFEP